MSKVQFKNGDTVKTKKDVQPMIVKGEIQETCPLGDGEDVQHRVRFDMEDFWIPATDLTMVKKAPVPEKDNGPTVAPE